MESINYVAWWGAALSTVVFIWDITKWAKQGPRIRHRIKLNVIYPDSKVLNSTKLEDGTAYGELESYCHIELINIGRASTTLMDIRATQKDAGAGQVISYSPRFAPHGKPLPHVLPPGEVWSCRLPMSDLQQLSERGKPIIEVSFSHTEKRLVIKPNVHASK